MDSQLLVQDLLSNEERLQLKLNVFVCDRENDASCFCECHMG